MSEEERNEREQAPSQPQGLQVAINFMIEKKIDTFLWLTRLGTIVFTILFLIPLFGVNPYTCYQRALMSNAATSAFRLHQRLPRVQLTREFGAMLLIEDSCHYLLYSILFLFSYPVTLALLPIFLFAVLHSTAFSIGILTKLGLYSSDSVTFMLGLHQHHQPKIFRLIAFTEICLMPVTVLWLFSGKGNLLTPFAYYRFLTFRYASRRNPYNKSVFHEMKVIVESFANTPGRNPFLKNLCSRAVRFVSYMAPTMQTQQ
ncbi:transmembrane protein 33-like [Uloborus diversus]|uniref:transmembrane protein 33-like n=1 Tax=Uloborus diversus TaxID=327109 RepID=UPI002409D5D6|nr:transmembrane protein 33-like [Uloborus diversus]XP_054716388.1 transmembrane protein 33-like [Uloborus diversus]